MSITSPVKMSTTKPMPYSDLWPRVILTAMSMKSSSPIDGSRSRCARRTTSATPAKTRVTASLLASLTAERGVVHRLHVQVSTQLVDASVAHAHVQGCCDDLSRHVVRLDTRRSAIELVGREGRPQHFAAGGAERLELADQAELAVDSAYHQ